MVDKMSKIGQYDPAAANRAILSGSQPKGDSKPNADMSLRGCVGEERHMSELILGVGPAHELEITLRKAGWEIGDVTKMTQDAELCRQMRAVLRGHAKIETVSHLINCDAAPMIPDGWEVEEHKKGGQLAFDVSKVSFYLSRRQTEGEKSIVGDDLHEELQDKPVLNANVLDYLLAHPELIPDAWKGKYLFFWGTIYRDSAGNRYVRCLGWSDGRWGGLLLGRRRGFGAQAPSAVLAR